MKESSPPFIDEHSWQTHAPSNIVWMSLLATLRKTMKSSQWFAQLLSCDPSTGTPGFEGKIGETIPGFRVETSEEEKKLVLCGSHRFASYKLIFIIDGEYLLALTYADFPGILGGFYRAAVISSGAHSIVTKRLLSKVVRRITRTASGDA